jgi:abhydrolase domain-containing protein 12
VVFDLNTKELISVSVLFLPWPNEAHECKSINAPIFIAHAENDWIIPTKHSQTLFDVLLEPLLTPLPLPESPNSAAELARITEERMEQRSALVAQLSIPNLGSLAEFTGKRGWRVVLLKTEMGGHQYIGTLESVQDIMKRIFRF